MELIRIQRQAREKGLDIVGFYHSHPDHPAQWSTTDFAEAHWLGCSYVITSVEKGKAKVTNSFLLTGTEEETSSFTTRASRSIWLGEAQEQFAGEQSMKIHIPTPLRTYTGGQETVSVPGTTVGGVLEQLTKDYPELQANLFTPRGQAAVVRQPVPERG